MLTGEDCFGCVGEWQKKRYTEMLARLFALQRFSDRDRLAGEVAIEMERASNLIGSPHRQLDLIHVAGTNGKGSVAYKVAQTLHQASYQVALFTSPHLCAFQERLLVGQKWVGVEVILEGIEYIQAAFKQLQVEPSFFMVTTLLGLWLFAHHGAEVAVIEVGIGGRLDPTNYIVPILSIITSIGLDHTEILGERLEMIAYEKGGIIKAGVPVILGPSVHYPCLTQRATLLESVCHQVEGHFNTVEEENCAIAERALIVLGERGYRTTERVRQSGLSARLPCRFELRMGGRYLFDIAHNRPALERLWEQIERRFPNRPFHPLLGLSRDKEQSTMLLQWVLSKVDRVYLFQFQHPRLVSPNLLLEGLSRQERERCTVLSCLDRFANDLLQSAGEAPPLIVVTGSCYMMEEALQLTAVTTQPR